MSESSVSADEHSLPLSHTIDSIDPGHPQTKILRVSSSLELTKHQLASLTKTVNPEVVAIDTGLEISALRALRL